MKSRKVCLADFSRFLIFYEMLTGKGKAAHRQILLVNQM